MEENKEPNNPWEARRVNMTRPQNLMYDIKKPTLQTSIPAYKQEPPIIQPPQTKEYSQPTRSNRKFYILLFIALILIAVAGYFAFYFYQKSMAVVQKTTATSESQLNLAINEIGKLVILPINDNPTLSVVVDPEEAKKNSLFALFKFFDNTETGDMWLSYQKTGKNILYRPTIKKIVNMMTFPPDALSPTGTSTATTTATTTKNR